MVHLPKSINNAAPGEEEICTQNISSFQRIFHTDTEPISYFSNDSVPLYRPPLVYTAFDDASWAITSHNLSSSIVNSDKQATYDAFIAECVEHDESCERDNNHRIRMNVLQPRSVINFTSTGFQKIRAPEPLFKLLKQFWDLNRHRAYIEMNEPSPYHNSWSVPTSIVQTYDSNFIGGGYNLSAAVWNMAREVLEEWTGQKLSGSSVYGIRVYHNQSILTPHVDRLPLGMVPFLS